MNVCSGGGCCLGGLEVGRAVVRGVGQPARGRVGVLGGLYGGCLWLVGLEGAGVVGVVVGAEVSAGVPDDRRDVLKHRHGPFGGAGEVG